MVYENFKCLVDESKNVQSGGQDVKDLCLHKYSLCIAMFHSNYSPPLHLNTAQILTVQYFMFEPSYPLPGIYFDTVWEDEFLAITVVMTPPAPTPPPPDCLP